MSGAWSHGKGDGTRPSGLPWEVADLNYDLACENITKQEYDAQVDLAWARARKRGWRDNRR